MALGTTHTSSTTLDTLIPELWGPKMNDFYRQKLILANFFEDLSGEFADGGDVMHIPSISQMTANTKGNGSQVTLNAPTETKVDLTVNTWKEVSFIIEDREAKIVKNSFNIQQKYMKNAAYTAAKAIDQAIADLVPSFTQTQGASTARLVDSDIRGALLQLDNAFVPDEDRAFFLTPKLIWTDVQAIDRFALAINTSGSTNPVTMAPAAMLYGVPIYKSTLVASALGGSGYGSSFLAHREAIVWAATIMRTQADYILEYLGTLVVCDVLYGATINRNTSGVWIKTAS